MLQHMLDGYSNRPLSLCLVCLRTQIVIALFGIGMVFGLVGTEHFAILGSRRRQQDS
jgi:hypothetical protein